MRHWGSLAGVAGTKCNATGETKCNVAGLQFGNFSWDEIYWFLWKTKKFPYLSGGRMYLGSQCVTFVAFVMHSCFVLHITHYAWLCMSHYHMLRKSDTYICHNFKYSCNIYWQPFKRPLKHKKPIITQCDILISKCDNKQCNIAWVISSSMAICFYRI